MSCKQILIADDEAYVTTTLAMKLRRAGYEVTTASNGEEALQFVLQKAPDLIVTDYQMPIVSGYEMAVKLKQNPATADIPLVMLTARGHHLSPEQLALTNIRALLAKPFSALEVVGKVSELLAEAQEQAA